MRPGGVVIKAYDFHAGGPGFESRSIQWWIFQIAKPFLHLWEDVCFIMWSIPGFKIQRKSCMKEESSFCDWVTNTDQLQVTSVVDDKWRVHGHVRHLWKNPLYLTLWPRTTTNVWGYRRMSSFWMINYGHTRLGEKCGLNFLTFVLQVRKISGKTSTRKLA